MNPISKSARLFASRLQEVMKVFLTDPEADKMTYFASILEEMKEMAGFYALDYPEFVETTRLKTSRTAYSQGGDCVHRGMLCPSPILNLLAGCNQGIVINSPDEATENFYQYLFDSEDQLLCVRHYNYERSKTEPDAIEFILWMENTEYGITFHSGWNEVSNVSKSVYREGRLENYASAEYDESTPDQMYLHYEEFIYEDNTPIQADVYFGISPELDQYHLDTFYLSYEDDEKLRLSAAAEKNQS